jgi:hypothetical protein
MATMASVRNCSLALAVGASLSTQTAHASCTLEYSTVVRARFIRCDNAQFYWDASGGDRALHDAIERELAAADPGTRELRRERIYAQLPEGPLGPQSKFVVVMHIDWQVSTTPWQPPHTAALALIGEPRKVGENVRYLWHGPPEACEASPGTSVDLWVTSACCDTYPSAEDGCRIVMSYAEPAPAPLREVLVKALEGR